MFKFFHRNSVFSSEKIFWRKAIHFYEKNISIPLAQELLKRNLKLVGTIKSNKKEISVDFKRDINREILSSIFGFSDKMTLVWFVTKEKKVSDFIELNAYDTHINPNTKKPQIVKFYNGTKSGVDTLDQLCHLHIW